MVIQVYKKSTIDTGFYNRSQVDDIIEPIQGTIAENTTAISTLEESDFYWKYEEDFGEIVSRPLQYTVGNINSNSATIPSIIHIPCGAWLERLTLRFHTPSSNNGSNNLLYRFRTRNATPSTIAISEFWSQSTSTLAANTTHSFFHSSPTRFPNLVALDLQIAVTGSPGNARFFTANFQCRLIKSLLYGV